MTFAAERELVDGFAADFLAGLMRMPKRLSAKYFYDETGSALFERICDLPEYYPTRVEMSLLQAHAAEFAALAGPETILVEFGAGALRKVEIVLDALVRPAAYVPIDISGEFLAAQADTLRSKRPSLPIRPLVADFTTDFAWPATGKAVRRLGFFPGSTIGNMDPDEAGRFLSRIRPHLSALLVGVDLVKDPAILHAAYNDREGVTAAFNKNMIARANRELGTAFDVESFAHYAFYNPILQRIEMHLVSSCPQIMPVFGRTVTFEEGESIHTENSYKYSVEGFQELALAAGYMPMRVWRDKEKLFSLHWLQAEPGF